MVFLFVLKAATTLANIAYKKVTIPAPWKIQIKYSLSKIRPAKIIRANPINIITKYLLFTFFISFILRFLNKIYITKYLFVTNTTANLMTPAINPLQIVTRAVW